MKKNMAKNGLILAGFAIIATLLIALTHSGTEVSIKYQQQQKLLSILNAIIATDSYNNDIQHDCTIVSDQDLLGGPDPQHVYRARMDGEAVAAAIETVAPNGYSGKIFLVVGVQGDGEVTGVRVLEHKETPGLGDKIDLRVSDWILAFAGQAVSADNEARWAVKKDGGQFDQFTGATITPRAVVNAVKKTVQYYQQHRDALFTADNQCAEQAAAE